MNIMMMPPRNSLKPVNFQGKSTDGYESDSLESLEQQLQELLTNLPEDEYIPQAKKIEFKFQDPQAKASPASPQDLSPLSVGRFQPLTEEAAAVIPPIRAAEDNQGLGRTLADQLQTLIRQGVSATNEQKQNAEKSNLLNESAQQRQLDEQKEIEKNHQLAKQKIVQMGLNTIGLATFGLVASSAFAVVAPAGAAGAAAMLAMGKLSAASALLGYTTNLFNTATELIGNKQSGRAVKSLISNFWGGFGNVFSFGKHLFGAKKSQQSVRFSGSKEHETEQKKASASTNELEMQCKKASERFYEDIDKATTEVEKNNVAQTLQKSLLVATQTFMLENGTKEEKEKIRQIQKFQTNFETLTNAVTASPNQKLTELSQPAQNHLRQMIFDTLTSNVPELQEWGKKQGRAIGMTMSSINRLLYQTR